jgi:formylglycine-generating enzyme required for sulfatase activity
MNGNVWEWVEDCWNESYEGAPKDGSAWTSGDCSGRMMRGGSWNDAPEFLRSASRIGNPSDGRYVSGGFRVARTLR